MKQYESYYFAHDYESEIAKDYLNGHITEEQLIDYLESSGVLTDGSNDISDVKPWGNMDDNARTNHRAEPNCYWVISSNHGLGYVGVTYVKPGES